jgi:diguanylate cyclase (GGDEF)-like protein/PAS domain S-box-containing protein
MRNAKTLFLEERTGRGPRVFSNIFYLAMCAILIFSVEFGVMFVLSFFYTVPEYLEIFFDALTLTAILLVLLNFMILRPLQAQIAERKRSEERLLMLKKAVESMNIGVTVADRDGRIVYCNPAEAEMHGYDVEELLGKEARVLSPPERWKNLSSDDIGNMKNWKRERLNLRKNGSTFPTQLDSNVVLNAKGEPIGIITNCEDITGRKEAEHAIQESEARYRSLVESTEDSIYLLDRDFRYIFINKQHLTRLGVTQKEILGKPYSTFHTEDETSDLVEKVMYVFTTEGSTQHEHRSRRDGKHFLRTLSPVRDADGSIIAVTVISKDIAKLKRMEDELRTLSLTDELTGLYNRRGLVALGEQQLNVADRLMKRVLVFYADLDGLKKVNDSFGHQEGDRLLVATAKILRDVFRKSDIVSRIGGDEFVCMTVDVGDQEAGRILSRLQEKIDGLNAAGDRQYRLSVTVGTTYYDPEAPTTLDDLIKRADSAMYELKRQKRN